MPSNAKYSKAAERALGLEPIGLETAEEARLRRAWELKLAPLGLAVREEMPPEDMVLRIMRSLDRGQDELALRRARRSTSRWRWATMGATALAAGLAFFAVAPLLKPPTVVDEPAAEPRYVAVASAIDGKGAVIVEIDLESKSLLVRPVGVQIGEDQDLQLWRIEPGGTPQSVGLVDTGETNRFPVSANPGDSFAISVEATGGVEKAEDHGPVGYIGELVAVPE